MPKKRDMKPKPDPKPESDDETRKIEERVERLLNPSIPDEEPADPPFEIIKEDEADEGDLSEPVEIKLADETDPATDQAVEEIQKQESDELLKAQDEEIAETTAENRPGLGSRLRDFLASLWHSKRRRTFVLACAGLLLFGLLAVPHSRYLLLNAAGVRVSASVVVLDESTNQPLKNVTVALGDGLGQTDQDGYIKLDGLKLGRNRLTVQKRAFAPVDRAVTLGWGSNPLGDFRLMPVGSQYSFKVSDFISGQPLEKAEAVSGEFSAFSDASGLIKLTVDPADKQTLEVTIHKDGYREEVLDVPLDTEDERAVAMAPAKPHVFISERSGRFDIYRIDADGKNEKLILKATGHEREDMVLVPHPRADVVALVSTRDGERNEDGFLLSTLTLIHLDDNRVEHVAQAERIQLVDWVNNRLVYVRISAGGSAAKADRHRLISYDYMTAEYTELARSDYFNDVLVANGLVYYAPSGTYGSKDAVLYRSEADGSERQTAMDKEAWNMFRTGYERLTISVSQQWYEYDTSQNSFEPLDGQPADLAPRVYTDSPGGRLSVWTDRRDGKGLLLVHDIAAEKDRVLLERGGLRPPVYWLNDSALVFRVNTEAETADYVISTEGGKPKKITDVTNTSGIDRWYYY